MTIVDVLKQLENNAEMAKLALLAKASTSTDPDVRAAWARYSAHTCAKAEIMERLKKENA